VSDDLLDIKSFLSDYKEREWINKAACKGMDPSIFFPERGDVATMRLAKSVCSTCTVSEQCYNYGLMEQSGVWGGFSTLQRQKSRGLRSNHNKQ